MKNYNNYSYPYYVNYYPNLYLYTDEDDETKLITLPSLILPQMTNIQTTITLPIEHDITGNPLYYYSIPTFKIMF